MAGGEKMRKLIKFGHSMTAITFLGSVVVLWVFHQQLPSPSEALEVYVAQRHAMARIASFVLMPSLLISLLFGMAACLTGPGENEGEIERDRKSRRKGITDFLIWGINRPVVIPYT